MTTIRSFEVALICSRKDNDDGRMKRTLLPAAANIRSRLESQGVRGGSAHRAALLGAAYRLQRADVGVPLLKPGPIRGDQRQDAGARLLHQLLGRFSLHPD